jgi:hypothetical protein
VEALETGLTTAQCDRHKSIGRCELKIVTQLNWIRVLVYRVLPFGNVVQPSIRQSMQFHGHIRNSIYSHYRSAIE